MESILSYFTTPSQKEEEKDRYIKRMNSILAEIEDRLANIEGVLYQDKDKEEHFQFHSFYPSEDTEQKPKYPFPFEF